MQSGTKTLIGGMLLAFGISSAGAITMVAGINFQDTAFADTVVSSSGSYTLAGAATLQAAVTGSSLSKYAFSSSPGASLQLGFTDNYLVNGAGNDLALFEFGTPSTFSVTISGVTLNYLSVATIFTSVINGTTYGINVAQINLDDFGVGAGAQFSSILVGMGIGSSVPSLGVVGALNSAPVSNTVPEAGPTAALLGMTFLSLGLLQRKFQGLQAGKQT